MSNRSINITRILPLIFLIALNVAVGVSVAEANGVLDRVELETEAKLNLTSSSRLNGLYGAKHDGLVRLATHETDLVKDLSSRVVL